MKLKQLEASWGAPAVELEQYPTGPHIASRLIHTAENTFGDITGKIVADFGCGCGTLGIASALWMQSEHVVGVDVDPGSLEIASENAEQLEVSIDLVWCDIRNLSWKGKCIDTVVMNPPFGTRRKGVDMEFLSMALQVASGAVYSLHKTSTREHVKKAALQSFNAATAEVLCEWAFLTFWPVCSSAPVRRPANVQVHKKKEVDVAVDLWRFLPQSVSRLVDDEEQGGSCDRQTLVD
ncbi:unnamed protein product [Spirodela intermedia]|uniref:Methyltransferase small domain-containing protein n=1 Tax=Spirodela intermedia TaxID=51605 RepID=A0A7I8J4P0_SPIIN|nr:unnamed protein product [Spirodela intermedia]CAA6665049.1 unnamed protein product [Spirodela intermedia]